MTNIDINVTGAQINTLSQDGVLTTGMVGATATFTFNNEWDDLTKTAVFYGGGVTKDVIMNSNVINIPWEVLQKEGYLSVGVEGRNTDGTIVFPTLWAKDCWIKEGANTTGDQSVSPTLPIWAELRNMIGDLDELGTVDKSSLVAAVNEALKSGGSTVDEATVERLVEEYLQENPPTAEQETDATLTLEGVAADAKAVGNLFISQKRRFSGYLNTLTTISIDTSKLTISFGNSSFVSWGAERIDVSNKTYALGEDLKWGGFLFYDPVGDAFVKSYSDGYVFVGALWYPFWKHELHTDRSKVIVDGMPVTYSGRYLDKKVHCLGDSMTDTAITPAPYCKWLPQLLGFDKNAVRNYGVGGSAISDKVDEIPTWDNVASFCARYGDMEADADAIIVFGGVNDWGYGHELGTIDDTTADTFYGAMKVLCEGLTTKYPTADIYVFSSPQNDYVHRPAQSMESTEWFGNTEGYNRKGYKLTDYVKAMSEVCAIYGIPFCDMTKGLWWGLSGVLGVYDSSENRDHEAGIYGSDSLHPNAEGHKLIALKMAGFINSGGAISGGAAEASWDTDTTLTLEGVPADAKVTGSNIRAIGNKLLATEKMALAAIPAPATATVGQTIVVAEVDEDRKPVRWECVDMPSGGGNSGGWKKLIDYTTETDSLGDTEVAHILIDTDIHGEPLRLTQKLLFVSLTGTTSGSNATRLTVNYGISGCEGFADFMFKQITTGFLSFDSNNKCWRIWGDGGGTRFAGGGRGYSAAPNHIENLQFASTSALSAGARFEVWEVIE